ncbi:unnamed protein product [Zymoseptoria tritici ST99CH_3D1]|uniref:Transcription factor Iwr1 domain-containing protein n=2 Tax=Zymoseptoria tritici TaxID=1047171 RepID=A0A1X7RMK5_ZYMT9|nr:unnamed protein product [Zymoseptoria tritici ST99CH_3D7]SMR48437.1 unnamed protein product [Zymoseptoria tritici ST99CH_1E4]SMR49650.1 unnamed protein product [Zymoseptoria tritici ST99CH_3D1]
MSGPSVVCIKRKRGDQAPDALLLERPGKRRLNDAVGIQYVRQRNTTDQPGLDGTVKQRDDQLGQDVGMGQGEEAGAISHGGTNGESARVAKERRTFHLTQHRPRETGAKKRKTREDGVATFIERDSKRSTRALHHPDTRSSNVEDVAAAPEAPLKRPGRRAAVINNSRSTEAGFDRKDQGLANELHAFAEQIVASENKPKVTALPKLSGTRSRELHKQSTARQEVKAVDQHGDTDMDEDADYVYDTYVLAPSVADGAVQVDDSIDTANVGYLVITDEDQDVWETYLEDDPSDKDWNSDEDDENAEDWYGADYPDDEMASDDEFGRGEHGYRARGAADDEEWDEDTGAFSDDEYERQMNPWRKQTPQSFARYLNGEEEKELA